MKLRKVISGVALLFIAYYCPAQSFKGLLINNETRPIEYANIVVYENDSVFLAGSMSDTLGKFSIAINRPVKLENIVIKISHISYVDHQLKPLSYELDTIILQTDATQLGEVVVTASVPMFRLQGSTVIANVSETNLRNVGTASKVLNFLPGIYSDGGQFKIFGKGAALFYLNNRKLLDISVLNQIASEDISTIEIIKNPGVEYPANTNAVIKIRTKRPKDNGLGLRSFTWLQQARRPSAQELLNLTFRHNKLDILGSINFLTYTNYQHTDLDYKFNTHDTIMYNGYSAQNSHNLNVAGSLGFNYYFNDKHSIGALYRYTYSDNKGDGDGVIDVSKLNFDDTIRDKDNTTFRSTRPNNRVGLYYSGEIGKLKLDFNNDFYEVRMSDRVDILQDTNSITGGSVSPSVSLRNEQSNLIFVSQLRTSHATSFGNFKEGIEYSATKRSSNYKNFEGVIPNADEQVTQNKYAAFVDYSHRINNVSISMGLRYEHVELKYKKDSVTVDGFPKRYSGLDGLFPSISISFPIHKAKCNFSYSRSTRQPDYRQLDGFISYNSKYLYSSGNIALEPAFIHDLSLSLSYNDFMFSADYINKKNNVVIVYDFYENNPEKNIMINTYINYKNASVFLFNASYSHTIGFWTPRLGCDVSLSNYNIYDISSSSNKFQTPYYAIQLSNVFELTKTFSIYLSGQYRSKGYDEYTLVDHSFSLFLEFQKSWNNWSLFFAINDPFRTVRDKRYYSSPICHIVTDRYYDTQNLQVTISYQFNPKRSKYKGRNVANNEVYRL